MTYFAPVGPLAVHQQLEASHALGPYNLLIAPVILKNPDAYSAFWLGTERPFSRDRGLLVDNGVIELGYPMPIDELYRAASIVGATAVILPDTIDDSRMTVKQVNNALDGWRKLRYGSAFDTVGVVQGTTLQECIECAAYLVAAGVDILAVPRGLPRNIGSRYELVGYLGSEYGKPMHLLGFSENIKDDIEAAVAHPLVRGIDAATPVWLGMAPTFAPLSEFYGPPRTAGFGKRPADFWERKGEIDPATIISNVATVKKWLSDAAEAHSAREAFQQLSVQLDAMAAPTSVDAQLDPRDHLLPR